jgi:tRNA(Ile)-lysidine synthase
VRPLLDIPKVRLIATLNAAKIPFASDPSNTDPRFTRVRMRTLMPALAGEGLGANRLALLARRMRRAEAALESAVDSAVASFCPGPWLDGAAVTMAAQDFAALPAEVGLRLLARAIALEGNEGAVELGKLEALQAALAAHHKAPGRFRRTLAGALITLTAGHLVVERAPARRLGAARKGP